MYQPKMPVDYKTRVFNLMQTLPFIKAVAVIEGIENVVYSTTNWDINIYVNKLISTWSSMKRQIIMISDVKYLIRICTTERLVASSIEGRGHIVGVKDNERAIIALIEPDGIIPFTTSEMIKILASFRLKKPYLDDTIQLGKKKKEISSIATIKESIKVKKLLIKKPMNQPQKVPKLDLPFTARLMAYYRAKESEKEYPLINDPFAKRLAGDLSPYLNNHIRFLEMDYPIVRSYYIEQYLLTPWCNTYKKSQIVLLGAGLDTRVYRFKPLEINTHRLFEIDFPYVIKYKQEILKNEHPLCDLVRVSTDLSNNDWTSHLMKSGFSSNTPTFWVLEGFAYYLEKVQVSSLFIKIAEISAENSQFFVDILHHSRWIPFSKPLDGNLKDPFSKHFKWDLDIRTIPSFFAALGWNISCSFADDFDQGRNVGQKGMIFAHGVRTLTKS